MKHFTYFPDTDTLHIRLSDKPATGGAENAGETGVEDDIIFSYDDQNRLISITIEHASKRADLSNIVRR